jgi:hypothetical protein
VSGRLDEDELERRADARLEQVASVGGRVALADDYVGVDSTSTCSASGISA